MILTRFLHPLGTTGAVFTLALLALGGVSNAVAQSTVGSSRLKLHKWSGDINVPDPVACTVDPQGRVYVTQTTRRKVADLDIREHTQWIPRDVRLESIEQKQAFYHEVLAPGKMLKPEGSLKDHNGDGSIDWKDLTVHSEKIYRLEDSDGDGVADKRTLFAEGFNTEVTGIAAGILWHDGWVYCTIAPDLWRLRDTNDDGVADEREVVAHGFGHHIAYAGHDMHGLCVGPDGRIYWTIGDKGTNVITKEGKRAAAPHQGAVLRCEPDGSGFEIFAHGLRNVQEVAFDDFGNLFGVDNDADKPDEKERLVFITEQSDSGWRCSFQYMKGYCPWVDEGLWQPLHASQPEYITPPLANSHDGPSGFAFNPGTALARGWKDTFFLNQFPSGKMNAMRVTPEGASFGLKEDKVVASGVMGIGMNWSPSGKLFMVDWGGDYPLNEIGAVWTVDDPAGEGQADRQETATLLKAGFENREIPALATLLGHADQRVRRGAQFALAKHGAHEALESVVLDKKQPRLARLHALWGLGQLMRAGKYAATTILDDLTQDQDPEIRALTARVLGDAAAYDVQSGHLVPLLSDPHPRVRFHAAIALGKCKTSVATLPLIQLAASNGDLDPWIRHACVVGLMGCTSPDALAGSAAHPNRAVRMASLLALRRLNHPGVAGFLKDPDPKIASEAARAIYDDESIVAALPQLIALLDQNTVLPEAVTRRALNACLRNGGKENAERLIAYALRQDAQLTLRIEALELAMVWNDPPVLDRVDGRYRVIVGSADPKTLATVALSKIDPLMSLPEKELKAKVVQLLTIHRVPVESRVARAAVMEESASPEVRVEALRLLADQHPGSDDLVAALDAILGAKSPELLRVAALDNVLLRDRAQAAAEAKKLYKNGTTLEKQRALAMMGRVQLEAGDDALVEQWDAWKSGKGGKVPAAVLLDLIEACQARRSSAPALEERLAAYDKAMAEKAGTAAAYEDCLEGGDVKSGKEIALHNLTANCTACHKFESKEGSTVGPALNLIGKQKERIYLLESLITPSKTIAPGFGIMTVTLKDGKMLTGTLVANTSSTLQLRLADGALEKIDTTQIESKTDPISVMPPMSAMLNKRQVRDLVAYLASLQGASPKKDSKSGGSPK